MRSLLLSLPLSLGLAGPSLALTQAELDTFLAAMAEQGCVMSAGTQLPASLTEATLREAILFLRENGGIVVDPAAGQIQIVAGPCAR